MRRGRPWRLANARSQVLSRSICFTDLTMEGEALWKYTATTLAEVGRWFAGPQREFLRNGGITFLHAYREPGTSQSESRYLEIADPGGPCCSTIGQSRDPPCARICLALHLA